MAQGVSDDFILNPATTPTSVDVATTGTSKLRIETIADADQEDDGTITVTLSDSSKTYLLGSPATASVTVLDNDDPELHSINITAVSQSAVTEADGAMAMFAITATGGTSGDNSAIAVEIEVWEEGNFLKNPAGTRTGIDVTPGITGSPGTAVPFNEEIDNDTNFEINGKIFAKIVGSPLYGVGENAVAEVAITNDDILPNITITAARPFTAEGSPLTPAGSNIESNYDFEVTLSEATPNEVEVNFTVGKAGDTALINDDYSVGNVTNTLTFPANSTDAQTINIDVVGDVLNEANETFTITLSLPAGTPLAALPSDPTIIGTIPNDDTAPVVSITDASGVEGSGTTDGAVEFTVSLSKPSGFPVKVNYSTTDGTATTPGTNDDYIEATNEELIIPASSNSVHNTISAITITTKADDTIEINEKFGISLTLPSDSNAIAGSRPQLSATGTILDDDAIAALTIADVANSVAESAGSVDFVVTSTVARTVTVNYQASEVNGADFLHDTNGQENATTDELTFRQVGGRGAFVDTLRVPIDNDGNGEVTGQIMVTLLAESGGSTTYSIPSNGDENAMVTILDDDAPELTIGSPTTVSESAGNVSFIVLARVSPNRMVPVNYDVEESSNGNGDFITTANEGTAATDTGKSATLDFTSGKTVASIIVELDDDDDIEADSTLTVTLTAEDPVNDTITNYTVTASPNNAASVTITDDDILKLPILSLTTTNFSIYENVGNFAINVGLDRKATQEVTYTIAVSSETGNNAIKGTDYRDPVSTSGSIAIGNDSDTIMIPIINDADIEENKTFTLTLSALSGAFFVGQGSELTEVITIFDDDSLPTITIAPDSGTVAEDAGPAQFMLFATGLSANRTIDINATPAEVASGDFLTNAVADTAEDFSVEFSDTDGDNTYTGILEVALDDDEDGEPTGDIMVTLNADPDPIDEYRLGIDLIGVITVLDDNAPELSISAVGPVTEADNAVARFMVTAEVSPNKPVRVYYLVSETSSGDGDFIVPLEEGNQDELLDFSSSVKGVELTVPIANDTDKETNGTVSVALRTDQVQSGSALSYTISATHTPAMVEVVDDDSLPEITIVADNGEVAEHLGPAQFMLMATGLSGDTTLEINATPAEDGGDFITDTVASKADFSVPFTKSESDDTYHGILSVTLDDDMIGEATGDIKVTLNTDPDPANTYRLGDTVEGVITIWDDDAPELSIAGGNSVTENPAGANATFTVSTLSSDISPNEPVTVYYTVSESTGSDFIAAAEEGDLSKELDFSSNATSVDFTIPITNDNDNESTGMISVVLRADQISGGSTLSYTIPVAPTPATVEVFDDDSPAIISIVADNGEVAENAGPAKFMLMATGLVEMRTISINAIPAEVDGDFLTDTVAATADFDVVFSDPDNDSTYNGELSVELHNDEVGEVTGDIMLTINDDPANTDSDPSTAPVYQLGSPVVGVITVLDDDAPALTITGGDPVSERDGAVVMFTVSALVSPDDEVMVYYTVSETSANNGNGDFLAPAEEGDKDKVLDFSDDATSVDFTIPLVSDNSIEDDAVITVALRADDDGDLNYTLGSPASATVEVKDDDSLPVITIAADSGDVPENEGPAQFMLTATGLTSNATLEINATPAEFMPFDFLTDAVADTEADFSVRLY